MLYYTSKSAKSIPYTLFLLPLFIRLPIIRVYAIWAI